LVNNIRSGQRFLVEEPAPFLVGGDRFLQVALFLKLGFQTVDIGRITVADFLAALGDGGLTLRCRIFVAGRWLRRGFGKCDPRTQ